MPNKYLVSTEWLQDHLDSPQLRIIDIRGHVLPASEPPPHYFNHRLDYEISHLPGAVFVDWVQEITDPADPRHAQIAKPERFADAMQRAGICDDETFVVTYDDAGGMLAARLWWALNYYGHSLVAVLDGGWQKWIAEKRPVSTDHVTVEPGNFMPRANSAIYRNADQVAAALDSATLIDVRSAEEFRGETSRAKRFGHIPGAVNRPRRELSAADGTLLPPDQLRAKFAESGVTPDAEEVILYCNGGVAASYGYLAAKVAGIENAAMYDGSWKDWGNDESRPIEK